jgi:uroporphyrinogen decarboxylase
MTPKEIIKRNLEFDKPERIGMRFGNGRMNDFRGARIGPSKTRSPEKWSEGGFEYSYDEWGNLWHRVEGKSAKGEIFRPALEDWSKLDKLKLPDYDEPSRYTGAKRTFQESPGMYHTGGVPGFPFAICRYLRKMEIYLQDLLLERKNTDKLHRRVTELLEKVIDRWAEAGADGISFCEDWGTQNGLLVSPAMWREIFKPIYARLCGRAREKGMHVLMHSCGYNREILEDLAETGVNCFLFDQPALYGLEELSRILKRIKVCLCSPVDIQKVLPTGDVKLAEEHAKKMIELFGKPDGGFIADSYGDLHGAGIPEEADEAAYRAFYGNRFLLARD